MKRDDICHALVSYFDIGFTQCHKPVHFSTGIFFFFKYLKLGPHAKYTHWKQTVFYLKEDIPVAKDDVITGKIYVRPAEKNPRDYDIDIDIDFEGKVSKVKTSQTYKLR